jgi:hypothetical protein
MPGFGGDPARAPDKPGRVGHGVAAPVPATFQRGP